MSHLFQITAEQKLEKLKFSLRKKRDLFVSRQKICMQIGLRRKPSLKENRCPKWQKYILFLKELEKCQKKTSKNATLPPTKPKKKRKLHHGVICLGVTLSFEVI